MVLVHVERPFIILPSHGGKIVLRSIKCGDSAEIGSKTEQKPYDLFDLIGS